MPSPTNAVAARAARYAALARELYLEVLLDETTAAGNHDLRIGRHDKDGPVIQIIITPDGPDRSRAHASLHGMSTEYRKLESLQIRTAMRDLAADPFAAMAVTR